MAASKSSSKKTADDSKPAAEGTWRAVAWVVIAGLWVLLVAALVSYSPADAPGHAVGVPAAEHHNWIGGIGAMIAHEAYLMLGPGVWLAVAAVSVLLIRTAAGKPVDQLVLRGIGVVLMLFATSAVLALVGPVSEASAARPEGGGGLVAVWVTDQLSDRFAMVGTIVLLLAFWWIGAILTADRLVMAIPRTAGELMLRVADVRRLPMPQMDLGSMFSGLGAVMRRGTTASRRPLKRRDDQDDLDDITEDTGGFAGTESFGQPEPEFDDTGKASRKVKLKRKKRAAVVEDVELEADAEDGVAAEAPDVYTSGKKEFDPEELRAKIAKMPINLAPAIEKQDAPPPEPDFTGYQFPTQDLLEEPEGDFTQEMDTIVREQAVQLESALQQYKIQGEVVGIDSGPVITLFEVRLAPGTKVSTLSGVESDLARALKAQNIRIVPNMAGKDTVGIEVPNLKKERVRLKELMQGVAQDAQKMRLPMYLGKDASGNPLVQDLASMPHMLIAGTTGSGKSVCMNSIIMSFLFTRRPDELKLVLVDPKMVEMSLFKNIPHLMCPVVTEMSKAAAILEWAVTKMDERYELLAEASVRDIASYNKLGEEELKERLEPSTDEEWARVPKKLPYMVFVIDELADLMMTNKEVEASIVRIAQKARAVGIHLILATQRPQANVVTGLIKSNMPCRVCMKVSSGMDSRIVLDAKGGELLLGHGDMLFLSPRSSKLTRAQGTLVDDSEIRKTTKFLKGIATQAFEPQLVQIKSEGGEEGEDDGERDPLFNDAVEVVLETQRGSVSLLQRRLTIGYSRSSRIIEQMERYGILGGHKTAQARQVLISEEEWAAMKAQAAADAGVADGEGLDAEAAADDHLESLDAVAEGDGDVVEAGADDDELDDVALADDGEEWEEVESA